MHSLPTFNPRPYQTIGAEFLIAHPRCMLIADPGLGKTGTVLMALDIMKLIGSQFFPVLVMAPKRVADVVWSGEAQKWSTFRDLSIVQIAGTPDERLEILRGPLADVYVCNYELADWLVAQWPQEKWPFRIVVADECSKLKGFRLNKGTKRAHALATIARSTGRWWNLTGTPMPAGIQDLWGEYWFLDFGERLKRSFTAFSEAYLIENPYSHRVTPQHGAEATIHEKIADITIAFRAEDWLDITQPQVTQVAFELPPDARKKYDEMEHAFFTEIGDAEIEAGTAAIKSMKLLELAAGSVYDDQEVCHSLHDARLDALGDILAQIHPEPLLLTYWFRFDAPRLLLHLKARGLRVKLYTRAEDESDWNAGKLDVLLLHEQSAHGLNLHKLCRDVCFYTQCWSAELRQQMIERVGPARQAQLGKKNAVRVWDIVANRTLDRVLIETNERKITMEQALKRARARRLYDKH
jgi:hypothetical protein